MFFLGEHKIINYKILLNDIKQYNKPCFKQFPYAAILVLIIV